MKKIKLFPAPHVEVRIHASDEMLKDFRECKEIAESHDLECFKPCEECSWNDLKLNGIGVCELEKLEEVIGDE